MENAVDKYVGKSARIIEGILCTPPTKGGAILGGGITATLLGIAGKTGALGAPLIATPAGLATVLAGAAMGVVAASLVCPRISPRVVDDLFSGRPLTAEDEVELLSWLQAEGGFQTDEVPNLAYYKLKQKLPQISEARLHISDVKPKPVRYCISELVRG